MRIVSIENDGTTTVELSDSDAHALRDVLGTAAQSGDGPAWTLHRLLAHAHGDAE
ncbi:hypothetical protein [Streptomyces sp. cg35]|uniref:hypothetical protein n=1 Tax=Streptomyces sp. cg35 TaxID=3421650 RepID=UPI003D17169D